MMQISHTPNGATNKAAALCMLCFIVYILLSCNSSHKMQSKKEDIDQKNSLGTYEETSIASADTNAVQEERTGFENLTDTSMRRALEISYRNNQDYANQTGTFEKLKPVVIKYYDDSVVVDPGGRAIEKMTLKDQKNRIKKDSSGTTKSTAKSVKTKDSSTEKKTEIVEEKKTTKEETKVVEKRKTPWYIWAIGGLSLALIIAIFLYIKKPSITKEIVEHLPDPAGIKKS